jgi:hypothetical protein
MERRGYRDRGAAAAGGGGHQPGGRALPALVGQRRLPSGYKVTEYGEIYQAKWDTGAPALGSLSSG